MSIPRRVVVGDTALEIRCIVEITHIKYADLRSIRRIPPETMKKKFVFFGSYGFSATTATTSTAKAGKR